MLTNRRGHHSRITDKAFQWLSFSTVVSVFCLVILGGVVRVTESGLGCPDWPLCHGKVIPDVELHAVIEYSHRLLASLVTILVLTMTVVAWKRYKHKPLILSASVLSLILILVQAGLGAITVLTELAGDVVMAHLALAEFLLFIITLIYVATLRRLSVSKRRSNGLPVIAGILAFSIFILILTGSYTTTTGGSGACDGWPLCQGQIFMSSRLALIHMTHRYTVLIATILVFAVVWFAWRDRERSDLVILSVLLVVLFVVQIIVGAATVWWELSALTRLLHLALGSVIWVIAMLVATLSRMDGRSFDPGHVRPLPPHSKEMA